jgi:Na+-translocating ferredoxin:NAD+ oxidoreductase RNF subunit RnfB
VSLLTATGAMLGLTFILATLLVLAYRTLSVYEDERIGVVEGLLPNVNCGGCGYPSCAMFAEALVGGNELPGTCTVSTNEDRERIASFLGVDVGEEVKRVARLACAGGNNVAVFRANYLGLKSCAAAAQIAGGGKECMWGCLGLADCETSCDFDAIHMNENDLPVVNEEKCIACNDCVEACPKDLFSIEPVSHQLWVACKNQEFGDQVIESCQVACTACERCAVDAPNIISMQNNLPVIDYEKKITNRDAIERCPTGAIVWINTDGKVEYGAMTKPVFRKEKLHARAT